MGSDPKHPLASKTVWLNTIGAAIAVVGVLVGQEFIKDNPMLVAVGALILGILNVLLRFVTDAPLSWGANTMKLLLLAVITGLPASLYAAPDDTAILVDGAVAAKYIVYVDGQGGVTFSPLARVVRPGPAPTPTPTPTPGPLTDRAKAIMAAAQKVPTSGSPSDLSRAETAKGLAELFRRVAAITPQATSAQALEAALKIGLDNLLSSRGATATQAWQPVRDIIGTQLTQLDFSKAPLADYATLFGEVASGLDASAPAGSLGISPQMLQLILQIVQIILALFKIPVPPLPM